MQDKIMSKLALMGCHDIQEKPRGMHEHTFKRIRNRYYHYEFKNECALSGL
jgi:hypothetical protein